jgi:hypothetical protein
MPLSMIKIIGAWVSISSIPMNESWFIVHLTDGVRAYKLADNQYVLAANIDGTLRKLKHSAYVYQTGKKRANRLVLRKGKIIRTYGTPYQFKNGKLYYRIGGPKRQYVKVSNFK